MPRYHGERRGKGPQQTNRPGIGSQRIPTENKNTSGHTPNEPPTLVYQVKRKVLGGWSNNNNTLTRTILFFLFCYGTILWSSCCVCVCARARGLRPRQKYRRTMFSRFHKTTEAKRKARRKNHSSTQTYRWEPPATWTLWRHTTHWHHPRQTENSTMKSSEFTTLVTKRPAN